MSHLNILTISKEIENLNKNIAKFQTQISDIEVTNSQMSSNFKDLNEIKINKLDVIDSIDQIRSDFKFLESKLNSIDGCVKKLLSRNLDFINKNTRTLNNFLEKRLKFNNKQINVLLFVFNCSSLQDCLLLNDRELLDFGFNHTDVSCLKRACKETLENDSFLEYAPNDSNSNIAMYGDNSIQLSNVVGV